jgi:hypothetical protein
MSKSDSRVLGIFGSVVSRCFMLHHPVYSLRAKVIYPL